MTGKRNKQSKKRSARKLRQRRQAHNVPNSSRIVSETSLEHRGTIHFTVASLPSSTNAAAGAFFDFERELEILKAALLYADRVKLCSVGASFMAGLHEFSALPTEGRIDLIKKAAPIAEPDAPPEELELTKRLADSLKSSNASGAEEFSAGQKFWARSYMDKKWTEIESFVTEQFDAVGGESFRQLLDTEYLELHPFTNLSADQLLSMGMESDFGIPHDQRSDETYDEYLATVLSTVQDGKTYPLFDDMTGDIVNEAVRHGVISPSQAARARSRHGGLSGDLMQNLPLFEKAKVSEVLDIRADLSDYLDNFRQAVSEFAECIQAASWEGEFSDEADRIHREQVAPAVRNIEQAIEENRYLKELLSRRSAPGAAQSTAASLATFVGSGSALWSLAVLALGLGGTGGRALNNMRDQRENIEGERLYFYYRAGQSLSSRRGGL